MCTCGETAIPLGEHDQGAAVSSQVSRELERDASEDQSVYKMILLGPGNSGKSTFLKQIMDLHGGGWDEHAKKMFAGNIHDSIIEQMQMLIRLVRDELEIELGEPISQYRGKETIERKVEELRMESLMDGNGDSDEEEMDASTEVDLNEYEPTEEEEMIAERLVDEADRIQDLPRDAPFNQRIAEAIQLVWNDQRMKDAFDCRGQLGVADSCPYFFNDILRFAEEGYIPTMQDILLARISTIGIREVEFTVGQDHFVLFDVGYDE